MPPIRTLLPFTKVRPTSTRNQFFHVVFEDVFQTCAFYFGKTYKCAVTVFTILAKTKPQCKKAKTKRTLQGSNLEQCLLTLATFWFNVGRCWHPFGSMLVAFGTFADPFWFLFINILPFGTRICQSTSRQPRIPSPKEFYLLIGPKRDHSVGTSLSNAVVFVRAPSSPKTQVWFVVGLASIWELVLVICFFFCRFLCQCSGC